MSQLLSISLTGDKKLLQNIESLDKRITTKTITKACRDVQKITAADARSRVPVKTGKLKSWIKVRAVPKKYLMKKFGLSKKEARAISATAVTTGSRSKTDYPYYALFLEKGTKERGTYQRQRITKASGGLETRIVRSNGEKVIIRRTGRIDAEKFDFLKPALYANVNGKKQIVITALRTAIASSVVPKRRP